MKEIKDVNQVGDALRTLEVGQTIIMPATIRSYVKVERLGVRTPECNQVFLQGLS